MHLRFREPTLYCCGGVTVTSLLSGRCILPGNKISRVVVMKLTPIAIHKSTLSGFAYV